MLPLPSRAPLTAYARATVKQNAAAMSVAATFVAMTISIGYVSKSSTGNSEEDSRENKMVREINHNNSLTATKRVGPPHASTTTSLLPLSRVSMVRCESARASNAGHRIIIKGRVSDETTIDMSGGDERPPSRIRRVLHFLGLSALPLPRVLTPSDAAFDYPELRVGLRCRVADEVKLRSLQEEAIGARNSGDPERIGRVFEEISAIAYGEGITPQMREDFLVKYGCTAWTEDVLAYLVKIGEGRGIVEIGAGNGQWARAIKDYYERLHKDAIQKALRAGKRFDFIIPYDDMTNLPLSPKVYHRFTKPANEYFHQNVQKCTSHIDAVRKWESRGRILLLVYPPPGPMAVETVRAYVEVYPEGNDTVVYVGEGRNGANGNGDLFDYFLKDNTWVLLSVSDVRPSVGGKGYEKMFVLRRVAKAKA